MSETAAVERTWKHWTEPEWVEVDGLRTAYRRKGTGAPLLYLHGAGMTRQWLPLHDELAKSFDVIVPEHPGFGDTEMPEWLRTFDDMVLHYDAFLRVLGIEDAHVVGHSLGAWIAAETAIFYPTRFASLTLISGMGLRMPEDPSGNPFFWSPTVANEKVFNGLAESYMEFLAQEGDIEQMLQEYGEATTFARLCWNPRYDVRLDRLLRRIECPTLVLHPADDNFIPRSHAERFVELIPGARLEIVEGANGEPATHVVIVQQPERVAAAIAQHGGAA